MNPHFLTGPESAQCVGVFVEYVKTKALSLTQALLNSEDGVSGEVYDLLMGLCRKANPELAVRISRHVDATDGRWYIPESRAEEVFY